LPLNNDQSQLVDLTYFDEPDPNDPDALSDPIKHWCLLVEIIHVSVNADGCPVLFVKGANGHPFFIYFFVRADATALYPWRRFCRPGNVMALMYASSYLHGDVLAVGEGEMDNIKVSCLTPQVLRRDQPRAYNTDSSMYFGYPLPHRRGAGRHSARVPEMQPMRCSCGV